MSSNGITHSDVLQASNIISKPSIRHAAGLTFECVGGFGGFESAAPDTDVRNVGSHFNQWRKPVTEYGTNGPQWEVNLKSSQYIGDINFGKEEWAEARETVDAVLDLLFKEVRSVAETFEGLRIERYVRQGSSREGLKVIAPDEFDTLLLYHIDGIYLTQKNIETKSDKIIPEFCKMTCNKNIDALKNKFPKLYRKGVFKPGPNGSVCLNSRALHQQVFQSIIDQSIDTTQKLIQELEIRRQSVTFKLFRSMNPPSINLKIRANGKEIDVDVVPGLLLRQDQVPDPALPGSTMDCPVYAVFKWTEETSLKASNFNDTEIVWRVCSSGYEKHTADVARCKQQQRYIITALRILKTYFAKTKKSGNTTPPQIVTVLRSYHLKHIAYYVILHTQYINHIRLDGVTDALDYFFDFLEVSLQKGLLPHFFHSNSYIKRMYPDYEVNQNALRFNLLGAKSAEALNQALLSFNSHLLPDLGFSKTGCENPSRTNVVKEYTLHISVGNYF